MTAARMTIPLVASVGFLVFAEPLNICFQDVNSINASEALITFSQWKFFESKEEILEFEKFFQTLALTVELCSHSVEKTKQCHTDFSVFQSGDLMRKKHFHLKVPFRKGDGL